MIRFAITLGLLFGGAAMAQVAQPRIEYVCIKACMVYIQGAPRPMYEVAYGQMIQGVVDKNRRYLLWKGQKGTYYADAQNFMLKSDLDAVYEQIISLQKQAGLTRQNIHEAKQRVVDRSPQTISGELEDDYGYTYKYRETVQSEGYDEARNRVAELEKSQTAIKVQLDTLKKKWGKLLTAANYPVVW